MIPTTPDRRSLPQKALDFYTYSSLHIGLCAFSFAIFGFLFFEGTVNFSYVICVGSATVALYSIHRLVGINIVSEQKNQGRFLIIKKYRKHIWTYFVLSSIVTVWNFLFLEKAIQFSLVGIGLLSVLYTIPFYKGKRLRDFNYIKIGLIGIIWTILGLIIPGILTGSSWVEWITVGLSSALFFIGITLPFDVRDIVPDSRIGVKTIPILIGADASLQLAKYLILCSLTIMLFVGMYVEFSNGILAWCLTTAIAYIFVRQFKPSFDDWYCSILIDGTIGLFFMIFIMLDLLHR